MSAKSTGYTTIKVAGATLGIAAAVVAVFLHTLKAEGILMALGYAGACMLVLLYLLAPRKIIASSPAYHLGTAAIAATTTYALVACQPVIDAQLMAARYDIAPRFQNIPKYCGNQNETLLAIAEVGGEVCLLQEKKDQLRIFSQLIGKRPAGSVTNQLDRFLNEMDSQADGCAYLYKQADQLCQSAFVGMGREHRDALQNALR